MKNKLEKARLSLLKFNDEGDVEKILEEMKTLQKEKKQDTRKTYFKKAYIVPFILAFLIACLTQTTGINCILLYDPIIFTKAGVPPGILSMLLGTGVTLVNFVITIIALTLIDKLGRKFLLIMSTGGIVICHIVSAIAMMLPDGNIKIILLTVGICGFIISYAIGCGIVVWVAMGELLPSDIRSVGIAICIFANSMVSSILATVFPVLPKYIGRSGIFFLLAGFSAIYFILAVFVLPETKGKTIEEIEEYFRHK